MPASASLLSESPFAVGAERAKGKEERVQEGRAFLKYLLVALSSVHQENSAQGDPIRRENKYLLFRLK